MTLHELDEAASLARRNLDVGDFTKALEEGAKLVLGNIAGEATNEDGGVVGVRELVHGLGSTIVAHWGSAHRVHTHARAATLLGHAHTSGTAGTTALVLRSSSRDAHWAVAAVNTLHLSKGLLLVFLTDESDEAVAARHSADGVGHDLSGLGGRVPVLEELDEDELGDFGAQVTDEDAVLGSALVAATLCVSPIVSAGYLPGSDSPPVSKTTTRGPVELEGAVGVRDQLAVESERFGSSLSAGEINETISSIAAMW